MGNSLAKLRAFLHHEAKRSTSNGIRPIEPVPMKIDKPTRYLLHARLCPFCRKARGKIRKHAALFQGVSPNPSGYVEPVAQVVEISGNFISSFFQLTLHKWK
jgi:hypothetical protein